MSRKIIPLAGAPILAVALTACGAFGTGTAGGGEDRQTSAQTTQGTAPSGPPQPAQGQPTAPATAAPQPRTAVARAEFSHSGREITVVVTALRRAGKVTSLNFDVTNDKGQQWQLGSSWGQQPLDYTIGGVSLVDGVNAKRYRPGRTGDGDVTKAGTCMCSSADALFIDEGETHSFYATFAAPPPDVTKVNIEIPQLGILTDVPLS